MNQPDCSREIKTDSELYFLQQHYGIPTRLLDWSNNALAALFFAVSALPDKDGGIFFMDSHRLAETQKAKHQGIATSRNPDFKLAMERICEWTEKPFPADMMAIRPAHADPRIVLQRSCFTFHVPGHEELTKAKENESLRLYKLPARAKDRIRIELLALGIDDLSIFGDMESLARRLRRAYRILKL